MKTEPSAEEILPMPVATHLGYLDALRALAALYIVVHHATLQVPDSENSPNIFIKVFVYLFRCGHYSVDLFIVLSGFCLMLPVIRNRGELRGGAIHFFKKRVRRILPPYYFAMGISLLLIITVIGNSTGTHWDVSIPVTVKDFITHLLLVQDIFPDTAPKINHVFWSISVEWRIYFLFPLLVLLWQKFGAFKVASIALISSFLLFFMLSQLPLNMAPWGICPHYIGLFSLGMLAAEISFSNHLTFTVVRQSFPWSKLTMVATVISLAVYVLTWKTSVWVIADIAAGCWATCLLVTASLAQDNLLSKILAWKPLIFIGSFAYSLYLIHAPLLQIVSQYILKPFSLTPSANLFAICFVGTPLIVGCSYLFFLLFERPFLSKSKAS